MKKSYILLFLLLLLNFSLAFYSIFLFISVNSGGFFPRSYVSNQGELSLYIEGPDNTAPTINLVYPEATTYTSHVTELNYTVSDNQVIGSCWYSLDNGETNVSVNCGDNVTGITSSEGSNTWDIYANDSAGNQNSDNVTFTVSIPSSGGGNQAGGGGGGGGGAAGTYVGRAEGITISPTDINLVLFLGEVKVQEITFENIGSSTKTINLSLFGINNFTSLNTNQIVLSPGEKKTVSLIVKSDSYGVYAGRIGITGDDFSKEILVVLNVQSSSSLFDVSLNLPQRYRSIHPGEFVKAFVSLILVGDAQRVDATATYSVKDFEGNTLLSESETFFVEKSKSFTREFDTSKLPLGEYLLVVEISYPGGFATSNSRFTVSDKFELSYPYVIFGLIGVAILALIFSILRYKKIRRYNYTKKRK